MTPLWTWGGKHFGRRRGDELYTRDGRHVGRFHQDEVYGSDGRYLGEIHSENRLITKPSKKDKMRAPFVPHCQSILATSYCDQVGYVMLSGYADFPAPEESG
jgi:hypothetical protein